MDCESLLEIQIRLWEIQIPRMVVGRSDVGGARLRLSGYGSRKQQNRVQQVDQAEQYWERYYVV